MYIKSSKNRRARRIVAEEEVEQQGTGAVSVEPEASELVFETEDVAELIAEVTGEDVEVAADENEITFTVGDTDYTVQAEGNEEILEATQIKGKQSIKSNRTVNRRPVAASTRKPAAPAKSPAGRTVRKISR